MFVKQFFKYKRKLNLSATSNLLLKQCREIKFNLKNFKNETANSVNKQPNLLFFGSDDFSSPSLQALYRNFKLSNIGVVTSLKNPANFVRQYATEQQIPVFGWPVEPDVCRHYDLGVVVSFGHMIPEAIINAFPYGMINVHASLLPRWRGAAPIIYAIMNCDTETGISIMKIEPKHFDIGDILAQETVKIERDVLLPEVHKQLSLEGAKLLIDVIKGFPQSLQNGIKQDKGLVTYAPKVTADIIEIDWTQLKAEQIYNRFRALYGFKNLSSHFQGKQLQIIELCIPKMIVPISKNAMKNVKPGFFFYQRERKSLLVKCADNTFIEIQKLRVERKKLMTAMDFNNGYLKNIKSEETLFKNNKIFVNQL